MGISSLLTSVALLIGLILFAYFGVYKDDVDDAKLHVEELNITKSPNIPNVLKVSDINDTRTDSTFTIKENNVTHERVIMMLIGGGKND